jgi:hypothetical protein
MGVHPNPSELFGPITCVDLLVKKVRDRLVVKGDVRPGTSLAYEFNVLDKTKIVWGTYSKTSNFCIAQVAQAKQLRPSGGTKP